MKLMQYYVMMLEPSGEHWVLDIHGVSKREQAQSSINWQHRGTNNQPMVIVVYKPGKGFEDLDQPGRFFEVPPTRSIYTEKAWEAFLDRLAHHDENGAYDIG